MRPPRRGPRARPGRPRSSATARRLRAHPSPCRAPRSSRSTSLRSAALAVSRLATVRSRCPGSRAGRIWRPAPERRSPPWR
ncbi:hypothetical protein EPN29_04845 [bacterium]|nr:MAG: hypothetical protein EPN29_04845 [bacterium]